LFAWLLNLAYLGLLAAVSPLIAFRMVVRGKYRTAWGQKLLGRVPRREGPGRCLWFHAVSVGEVLQLQPLIEGMTRLDPAIELAISTTTPTGYEVARRRFPDRHIFYFPLDFSWAVDEALSRVRPWAIALVELELWPNFVCAAAKRGIPVMLINARVSERSHRGYRRIRPLIGAVLRRISLLAVQSETYAARLKDLGASSAAMHVTGSIKFDRIETDRSNPATANLRQAFGLCGTETVFIAGSTQAPEERFAIESYVALQAKFPDLRLILVPRHQDRFDEVAHLVEDEFRLPLIRRSQSAAANGSASKAPTAAPADAPRPAVMLLDTLGELSACWGLATIAFVGGSLTRRGGQNMIEPAGYGAAVLFGPNTWNFKDVVDLLLADGAARIVRSPDDLTAQIDQLLSHPDAAIELGRRARRLVTSQAGAAARTIELIADLLADDGEARIPPSRAA